MIFTQSYIELAGPHEPLPDSELPAFFSSRHCASCRQPLAYSDQPIAWIAGLHAHSHKQQHRYHRCQATFSIGEPFIYVVARRVWFHGSCWISFNDKLASQLKAEYERTQSSSLDVQSPGPREEVSYPSLLRSQ